MSFLPLSDVVVDDAIFFVNLGFCVVVIGVFAVFLVTVVILRAVGGEFVTRRKTV